MSASSGSVPRELAAIRRRTWVGLLSGIATMVGLELYVVDFSSFLPAWWLALVRGLTLAGRRQLDSRCLGARSGWLATLP